MLSPLITWHPEWAELIIRTVSAVVLVVFLVACMALVLRHVRSHDYLPEVVISMLLMLTSAYVVMMGNLNGYFDALIVLLAIAAMSLVNQGHAGLASMLAVVAVLVHETFLFVGLPSLLPHMWLSQNIKKPAMWLLACVSLSLLVFTGLAAVSALGIEGVGRPEKLTEYLSQFPFIASDRQISAPMSLTKSFLLHWQAQHKYFSGRLLEPAHIVGMFIPLIMLMIHVWRFCRHKEVHSWLWFLLALIIFMPLCLHAIAWDTTRIWTYPFIVVLLALSSLSQLPDREGKTVRCSWVFPLVVLLVIFLQCQLQYPLMDESIDRFAGLERLWIYGPALLFLLMLCMWPAIVRDWLPWPRSAARQADPASWVRK